MLHLKPGFTRNLILRLLRESASANRRVVARGRGPAARLAAVFLLLGASIAALISVAAMQAQAAQKAEAADSGVFFILSGEKRVGTEKFKITPVSSGLEVSGELEVEMPGSGKVSETSRSRSIRTCVPRLTSGSRVAQKGHHHRAIRISRNQARDHN